MADEKRKRVERRLERREDLFGHGLGERNNLPVLRLEQSQNLRRHLIREIRCRELFAVEAEETAEVPDQVVWVEDRIRMVEAHERVRGDSVLLGFCDQIGFLFRSQGGHRGDFGDIGGRGGLRVAGRAVAFLVDGTHDLEAFRAVSTAVRHDGGVVGLLGLRC